VIDILYLAILVGFFAVSAALVYGLELGIAGSAIGTVLAQSAAAAAYLRVVVRGARQRNVTLIPDWAGVRHSFAASAPLVVRNIAVRAVVAIAPAGGGALPNWGADGLAAIHAPIFFIAGDHDLTVDYASGARTFLEQATGSDRWLLTFLQGGHALGFGPAPESMSHSIWDYEWFEDAVWRKERLVGVELHFITAFLDRYLRGDESRAAYLDVPVEDSGQGSWPAPGPATYGDYSPGTGGVTVWKGFPNRRAAGLTLLKRTAASHD